MRSEALERMVQEKLKTRLERIANVLYVDLRKTVSVVASPIRYPEGEVYIGISDQPGSRKFPLRKKGRPYTPTRATPGAPPRMITGKGRASIGIRVEQKAMTLWIRMVKYMGYHERGNHKWLWVTWQKNKKKYMDILKGAI